MISIGSAHFGVLLVILLTFLLTMTISYAPGKVDTSSNFASPTIQELGIQRHSDSPFIKSVR
jgi:hypothetical protein